jgi:ADP-ribose pyrophosphatase YjhB (NUDIX family)
MGASERADGDDRGRDGDGDRDWRDVRPMVLGIVWRDDRMDASPNRDRGSVGARELLVSRLGPFDGDDSGLFYRPPGGGVEFGETTAEAVVREYEEELDATVTVQGFAGVVENRFEFLGERDHELCFVYEIAFADDERYATKSMHGVEHDSDVTYDTEWATLDDLDARDEPLYPRGLREVLETDRSIVVPSE